MELANKKGLKYAPGVTEKEVVNIKRVINGQGDKSDKESKGGKKEGEARVQLLGKSGFELSRERSYIRASPRQSDRSERSYLPIPHVTHKSLSVSALAPPCQHT